MKNTKQLIELIVSSIINSDSRDEQIMYLQQLEKLFEITINGLEEKLEARSREDV